MDQNCQFDDELKECNRERQEVQQQNLVSQNEGKKQLEEEEQIEQNALERQRELARERSRRYRDNKHFCPLKTIQRVIHNSQISGTSTNMNVPFVVNDYSANINDYGKFDHELKPKRELANASKREQRKRKHQELQQQNLVSQNEGKKQLKEKEQIEQNAVERQRDLAGERSRRYRDKKQQCKTKQQEVQQQNLVSQNEGKEQLKEQIEQNALERQRELARERTRRYRDNKRLCPMKTIQRVIHNSQIPGTSTNMDIPIVVNDYSANVNDYERKCSGHSQDENLETHVVPLEDQAHVHSSAHTEFHKQFTQNSFGHVCTICDRLK